MEKVTGSENRGPLSELETEAEAEEEEPGAAALEDPEEQPTSIPAAIAAEQRSAMLYANAFSNLHSFSPGFLLILFDTAFSFLLYCFYI